MSKIRVSKLFNDKQEEINVSDLEFTNVNSTHYKAVRNVANELSKRNFLIFTGAILATIFASYVFFDTINDVSNITSIDIVGFGLIGFLFGWASVDSFIQLFSTIRADYKKAQYGIVTNKYYQRKKTGTKGNHKKHYYTNVEFKNTNTYFKKANCTYKVYRAIEEGDEVLVVSFDNKKVYVVPINYY